MILRHITPQKQSSSSDHAGEAIDTTRPPEHSDIPPEHWRTICKDVARLAPSAGCFWPVWVHTCKRHLRRYSGRPCGGIVLSSTTMCILFEVYERSGGRGTMWEPWVEERQQTTEARRQVG